MLDNIVQDLLWLEIRRADERTPPFRSQDFLVKIEYSSKANREILLSITKT